MSKLTGSTEEQSSTLMDLQRQEREALDAKLEADAHDEGDAVLSRLYEEKHGICDFCRKPIDQPADAETLVVPRGGKSIRILIHKPEWLKASLSGWKLAPEIRGSQS